jgi:pyruvate carboxylase
MGYQGHIVSPYYDSLLCKVICTDRTFKGACQKLYRALDEFRVRGVKTNISFVKNVLNTPEFYNGSVDTSFIDANPHLMQYDEGENTRM